MIAFRHIGHSDRQIGGGCVGEIRHDGRKPPRPPVQLARHRSAAPLLIIPSPQTMRRRRPAQLYRAIMPRLVVRAGAGSGVAGPCEPAWVPTALGIRGGEISTRHPRAVRPLPLEFSPTQ